MSWLTVEGKGISDVPATISRTKRGQNVRIMGHLEVWASAHVEMHQEKGSVLYRAMGDYGKLCSLYNPYSCIVPYNEVPIYIDYSS